VPYTCPPAPTRSAQGRPVISDVILRVTSGTTQRRRSPLRPVVDYMGWATTPPLPLGTRLRSRRAPAPPRLHFVPSGRPTPRLGDARLRPRKRERAAGVRDVCQRAQVASIRALRVYEAAAAPVRRKRERAKGGEDASVSSAAGTRRTGTRALASGPKLARQRADMDAGRTGSLLLANRRALSAAGRASCYRELGSWSRVPGCP
jgi:hypothetical protein